MDYRIINEERKAVSKKQQIIREFWHVIAIVPTSWALFSAFCTVYGIVELLGPFFRAMIFYWKFITREFWNKFFEWVDLGIDINLNDPDKDGLTLALFFFIFGSSSLPTFYKIICSDSDDEIRKVNWALFPIASFVSMAMVSLVVSSTTGGSVYSADSQMSLPAQVIMFFVIMSLIYFLVAFIPNFSTYVLSYLFRLLGLKNYFIIISPVVFIVYVAWWATWIPEQSEDLNLMSSMWVTTIVVSLCLFIPMWIPIVEPKKLIKLLLVTILISAIAFVSLGLDYLKVHASIPGYSFSEEKKSQTQTLSNMCKKNLGAIFLLISASQKMNWQHGALKPCDCLASEMVKSESDEAISKLSKDFGEFMNFSDESKDYYLSRCIPIMQIESSKQ